MAVQGRPTKCKLGSQHISIKAKYQKCLTNYPATKVKQQNVGFGIITQLHLQLRSYQSIHTYMYETIKYHTLRKEIILYSIRRCI